MKPFRSLLILISVLFLGSAASAQSSTVYFYRLKSLIQANTPAIFTVNDTLKITLDNGTYKMIKTNATSLAFITSQTNNGIKSLALEKGKTYYVELEMKGINSTDIVLRNEFSGKPAIERLQADAEAKKINPSDLKALKVLTIEKLPAAEEQKVKVYLYRPFNVGGVGVVMDVAVQDSLFQMKNGSSHIYYPNPGELTFYTLSGQANTSNASLKLNVEKGKVYYIAVLRTGSTWILRETKEQYAKMEMKLE